MSSWTTQELSLPAKVGNVVSRTFLVREPQYLVVEITGATGTGEPIACTVTIEDSADGENFTQVISSSVPVVDGRAVYRFDASVTGDPMRNICRISTTSTTFTKVFVTWSP